MGRPRLVNLLSELNRSYRLSSRKPQFPACRSQSADRIKFGFLKGTDKRMSRTRYRPQSNQIPDCIDCEIANRCCIVVFGRRKVDRLGRKYSSILRRVPAMSDHIASIAGASRRRPPLQKLARVEFNKALFWFDR